MEKVEFSCGFRYLQSYLKKNTVNFSTFTLEDFKAWLSHRLERKKRDQVFMTRAEARDLRRQFATELETKQGNFRKAKKLFSRTYGGDFEHFSSQIQGVEQAIKGLSKAVQHASDDKKEKMEEKLKSFQEKHQDLENKLAAIEKSSEFVAMQSTEKEFESFRTEIGLAQAEEKLKELQTNLAKRLNTSGSDFEEKGLYSIYQEIIPSLLRKPKGTPPPKNIHVLSSVKLGVARAEIDYVIVRTFSSPNRPVQVLAVIEVKRDVNDVCHGFTMRQENISFLCGNTDGYDQKAYRTKVFKEGLFDQPAIHTEHGQDFLFEQSSFSLLRTNDSGLYTNRLYFINDNRPLVGLKASEVSKLFYRISNDIEYSLDNDEYLSSLLANLKKHMGTFQTRQVLELYGQDKKLARHIIFIHRQQQHSKK